MDKLRKVEVDMSNTSQGGSGIGYFHGFFPYKHPYMAKALIELTDGTIIEVLPEFIRFLDRPNEDPYWGFEQ